MKVHTIFLFDLPAIRLEWSNQQREKGRRGSVTDARFLSPLGGDLYDVGVLVAPADDADIITKLRTMEQCVEYDTTHLVGAVPLVVLSELRYLRAKGRLEADRRMYRQ